MTTHKPVRTKNNYSPLHLITEMLDITFCTHFLSNSEPSSSFLKKIVIFRIQDVKSETLLFMG